MHPRFKKIKNFQEESRSPSIFQQRQREDKSQRLDSDSVPCVQSQEQNQKSEYESKANSIDDYKSSNFKLNIMHQLKKNIQQTDQNGKVEPKLAENNSWSNDLKINNDSQLLRVNDSKNSIPNSEKIYLSATFGKNKQEAEQRESRQSFNFLFKDKKHLANEENIFEDKRNIWKKCEKQSEMSALDKYCQQMASTNIKSKSKIQIDSDSFSTTAKQDPEFNCKAIQIAFNDTSCQPGLVNLFERSLENKDIFLSAENNYSIWGSLQKQFFTNKCDETKLNEQKMNTFQNSSCSTLSKDFINSKQESTFKHHNTFKEYKKPFFLFDENEKCNFAQNQNIDIWKPRQLNFQEDQQQQQQQQKQKKSNDNSINNKKAKYSSQNISVDYKKIRFSTLSKRDGEKHFEFNCFNDKDLLVPDEYMNKLQEISFDDDVMTDDSMLENYVEQCFSDLLEGIEMQPNKEKNYDLWEYFQEYKSDDEKESSQNNKERNDQWLNQ